MSELRVLFWNLRRMAGDSDAVVRVVRESDADVLIAAEGPGPFRWRPRAAALARRCDMVVLGGGRPAGGTVLACGIGVERVGGEDALLPAPRGVAERGIATALCRLGGAQFLVAGTRLGTEPVARAQALGGIRGVLERSDPAPLILAGDLEVGAASAVLGRDLHDALADGGGGQPTPGAHPATPNRDTVLIGDGVKSLSAQVIDSDAARRGSDHRPVLVTLDLISQS